MIHSLIFSFRFGQSKVSHVMHILYDTLTNGIVFLPDPLDRECILAIIGTICIFLLKILYSLQVPNWPLLKLQVK